MSLLRQYLKKTPDDQQNSLCIAQLANLDVLMQHSPFVAKKILQELQDQRSSLKLIASENYSSLAVQLSMGNWLTDKYSEGYPHHRFYAGCENIDEIEDYAAGLLKKIFNADHAYVQPHSGADANMLAFWSILVQRVENKELERLAAKNVDSLSEEEYERIRNLMNQQKVLGMSLSSGGHLSHGYRHNFSSKMMRARQYHVNPESGLLDYDKLADQIQNEKPDILLSGYSAYPRKINFAKMREMADSVGAVLMVDMAHFSGLVAGKVLQDDYNPVPFADIVTSTTHKTLRGPRGGLILCSEKFRDTINKGCPLVLGGPLPHVIAAKAIAFEEAAKESFQSYAKKIVENASTLADELLKKGVELLTGGTENHMILFKCQPFGLSGRQVEAALRECGLTVNRNAIPFDELGPWYTSGIRIGTAALTSLGMQAEEMKEIAALIYDVLTHCKANYKGEKKSLAKYTLEESCKERVKQRIADLLAKFPLYPELVLDTKNQSFAANTD